MEREMDLKEVSDGKLYTADDMVRADCGDCRGCSACCRGMGNSVVLDPYDIYRLTTGRNIAFESLLEDKLDLNVVEGIILPNLKMAGREECCVFLDKNGRCSIHALRPGICRIFPLGRLYENGGFRYFLQVHECKNGNRTKTKVKKWVDTPNLKKNEAFINEWHYFLKAVSARLPELPQEKIKQINLYILNTFFMEPYQGDGDFYEQFARRMQEARERIG